MGWIILLIFIGGPILELSLLIDVGGEIGGLNTILLCMLTAFVGLSLVRAQGIQVMNRMREQMQAGEAFGQEMIHGFFLMLAGLMLMFPGFITDTIGGLLLIPFVRLSLGKAGVAAVVLGGKGRVYTSHTHSRAHSEFHAATDDQQGGASSASTVVDIESVEIVTPTSEIENNSGKEGKDTTRK